MKSTLIRLLSGWAALSGALGAQTLVDLRGQSRNVDFSAAAATKPFKTGAVLPASCTTGETYFKTDAAPGQNVYGCTSTNTWTALAGISDVTVQNSGPGAVELLKSGSGMGTVTGRQILTGEGTLITQQTDTVTVEVDTAVTPRYATAATAPTGACQTGRDHFTRVSGFPHFYGCVGGSWKPVYAVTASAPATCLVGELYFNSADGGFHGCTAVNTWTQFNRTGLDLTSAGECFITYSCVPTGSLVRAALPSDATAGHMVAIRVMIPNVLKLARGLMYIVGGGSAQAFSAAVYRNNGGAPGTKIDGSELRFLDLSAGAFRQGAWGDGSVVLVPGVYWIGFSSESAVAQYQSAGANYGTIGKLLSILANPGLVACSNLVAGTGSTYTLPSSCGTASALGDFSDAPIVVAAAQ